MIDQIIIKVDPALTGSKELTPFLLGKIVGDIFNRELDGVYNVFVIVKENDFAITIKEKTKSTDINGIPKLIIDSMEALKESIDKNFNTPIKWEFESIAWKGLKTETQNKIIDAILLNDDLTLCCHKIIVWDSIKAGHIEVFSHHKDFTGKWQREAQIRIKDISIKVNPIFINKDNSGK